MSRSVITVLSGCALVALSLVVIVLVCQAKYSAIEPHVKLLVSKLESIPTGTTFSETSRLAGAMIPAAAIAKMSIEETPPCCIMVRIESFAFPYDEANDLSFEFDDRGLKRVVPTHGYAGL